jgi:hypothetical protein
MFLCKIAIKKSGSRAVSLLSKTLHRCFERRCGDYVAGRYDDHPVVPVPPFRAVRPCL